MGYFIEKTDFPFDLPTSSNFQPFSVFVRVARTSKFWLDRFIVSPVEIMLSAKIGELDFEVLSSA